MLRECGTLVGLLDLLDERTLRPGEAATLAVEQMHRHTGDAIINELHRANLRPTTLKPLVQRLSGADGGPVDIDDEGGGGGASLALMSAALLL